MKKPWYKPKEMKSNLPEFEVALKAAKKAGEEIIKIYESDFSSKIKDDRFFPNMEGLSSIIQMP